MGELALSYMKDNRAWINISPFGSLPPTALFGKVKPHLPLSFGVYPGHVPYVSMLGDGIAHIIGIDNSDMRFKTSGGFAFIRDDRVSILIEKTEEAIPLD